MLQTKGLTKSCGTVFEVTYYGFEEINLTWKGRDLVLALFASWRC